MTSDHEEATVDAEVTPQDPVHADAGDEAASEAVSTPVGEPADSADSVVDSGPGETTEEGKPAEPSVEHQLAERTADLQRLQAEYLNYKRRVDRDREAIRTNAIASVVSALLPVLDDIGRARQHDELYGGFKSVADSLVRALESYGLVPFGEEGDRFDPTVHEAMQHGYSNEVTDMVADQVLQVGYRMGDQVLRPARVTVLEPSEESKESEEQPAQQ